MTVAVFGSARAAPGVTTLAVAVTAWLERGVLVEADPDGGVLAPRYRLGREPGLVTLAAARAEDPLLDHAQRLPGGLPVVVAPESAGRVEHVWRTAGRVLVRRLVGEEWADVVVDAGRLRPSSPVTALVPDAVLVAIVTRPTAAELLAAAERVRALRQLNESVGVVLVGDGPYSARDVTDELECDVLGTVAHDRRAAEALEGVGGRRMLARSALLRSARTIAEEIARRAGGTIVPVADRLSTFSEGVAR